MVSGSGPDVAAKAFTAEYVLGKDGSGNEGLFSHESKDEKFRWMANVPKPTDGLKNRAPYSIDCRARVVKPGFRCPVPYGFTQEGYGLAGAYSEGVIQLRQGSPKWPIVATGFTEMIMLTEPFPDGTDPSMGPAISRPLPNKPDEPWNPTVTLPRPKL